MTPADQYASRLAERESQLLLSDRLHGRMGTARLLLAAVAMVLLWAGWVSHLVAPAWAAVAACAFIALVAYHRLVIARNARLRRAVAFHRDGLARLQGRGPAGPPGNRFVDLHHPYGADLDVFGPHSLFAALCTARTPMGEDTLARWLLAPATLDAVRRRQAGVSELSGKLDLREDLAILGDLPHIGLHPAAVDTWLGAPRELAFAWLRPMALGLIALAAATAVLWATLGIATPFLAVLVIEAALNHALRERVDRCIAGIEHAHEDLKLVSALLARLESQSFDAAPLRDLARQLSSGARTASATLAQLATLVNFVEARRNPFLTPLLLPSLYAVQAAQAAERWRERHGAAVLVWLTVLGEFEALGSIAAHAFDHPDHVFPAFVDGPAAFDAGALGHPLIAASACVRNDVRLGGSTQALLVSGSNMSGKSTLLRAVGLNVVLAMAGAPVRATRLSLTPLQVGASIRVVDSLSEGSSRFYAEITRLRQLFEPSALPRLFLLDELLQGTNSLDRRIGAQGVVRALLLRGGIGLVSTHDLALTEGTGFPVAALRNVHFEDELVDGRLSFDFKLREGVVTRSNGVELMRAIGLDV